MQETLAACFARHAPVAKLLDACGFLQIVPRRTFMSVFHNFGPYNHTDQIILGTLLAISLRNEEQTFVPDMENVELVAGR